MDRHLKFSLGILEEHFDDGFLVIEDSHVVLLLESMVRLILLEMHLLFVLDLQELSILIS